jgi:Acetyltransferase (GNAT) domain
MAGSVGELIPLEEPERWNAALQGIPHGFGHTWDSCHAFALTTQLPTYLYLAECTSGRVICPLIERRFHGEADVATPFGFSGFAGRGRCAGFDEKWRAFASRTGWVCAYVGQNPMLRPEGFWAEDAFQPSQNLYWLRIDDLERLHRRLSRLRKRQLKRWRVAGWLSTDRDLLLRFVIESADGFFQRVGAAPNYFFLEATWRALAASKQVELLGALRNDRVVAVTFFGWADGVADALFNISLPEGRDAATALLIEGAERLSTRGISLLNIGGGIRPGDDVERAKQLFGATAQPLLHMKQVFAPNRFNQLCAAAGAEVSGPTGFFPPYHSQAT